MESLADTLQKSYEMGPFPVFLSKHCMNASAFGRPCRSCVDLCPEKIFDGKKTKRPDFSKCARCGLCAAACPSGAIVPMRKDVKTFLMALARGREISVGCEDDEDSWDISLPCLAVLSWEQIACAALTDGICISLRACEGCGMTVCREQVGSTLDKVRRFLGDMLFHSRVKLLREGEEHVFKGGRMSRRDLLTFFQRIPLDVALESLPDMETAESPGLFFRALLRDTVRRLRDETPAVDRQRYVVELPHIKDNCTVCGMCQSLCPERALELQKTGEGGTLITIDVWRCTACGICGGFCRSGAIDGTGEMAVTHLDKVIIKRLKPRKETS